MIWRSGLRVLKAVLGLLVVVCMVPQIAIGWYVENQILARQDHQPHPEQHATVPCEYKGGDFYCTPFEAGYLKLSDYGMIAGVGGIFILAALDSLRRKDEI